MYFLDSGSYASGYFDWFGFFKPTEYDYLRQDQINWFLQESGMFHFHHLRCLLMLREGSIAAIERPFTPDGANDLGKVWPRQSDQITPSTRKLAKPNALMFFHIPL